MGRSHPWWATVGYLAVLLLVFSGALWPGADTLIFGDDIHREYYFYRQFFNNSLKEGIWPWWNPYNFAGTPFIANPIVNIWYPPTWLFFFLPLNGAYSWHLTLHLLWAMLGMYVLVRYAICDMRYAQNHESFASRINALTHQRIGPWIAGLVFGLSGFFSARIWAGHVDVIAAASWLPWVFGAFWQLIQEPLTKLSHGGDLSKPIRRQLVVAAVILAMQLYAGYQTIALFTLEAVAVFIGISHIANRASARTIVTTVARVALSVFLAIGLFAVVLLPQQEFFRQTIRTYALPYSWNAYGSLEWRSLVQLFHPFPFGDHQTYTGPPPNFAEHAFFVGRMSMVLLFVTLFFSVIRFWSSRRTPGSSVKQSLDSGSPAPAGAGLAGMTDMVAFFVIALFGLWVSLGPNAPIDLQYVLWKLVPMYKFLRIPPRHLILFVFGVSGLVGIAVQKIYEENSIFAHRYWKFVIDSRKNDTRDQPLSMFDFRFSITNFHFLITNFVFRFWKLAPTLLVVAITIEMLLYARQFIALKPIPEARHDGELIRILTQDREPYRVLPNFGVWVPPRDSLDFAAVMNYRIYSVTGYDTMILRRYYEYIDAENNADKPSILEHDVQVPYLNLFSNATDFLNIKYILVPRGYDPLGGNPSGQAALRFRLIREDIPRDYRLYENKTVLPRFYFPDGAPVTIARYSPNEIILTTNSASSAWLMSSEVFYPGWEGFVDGEKVDVQKASHAFRALFVPAGPHTVIYRYSPRIFFVGGAVTLLTILAILLLLRKNTI